MSSSAMKWARRQRIHDGSLSSVVRRLAELADDTGVSWASQARLAHDCGMSERSVRRALCLLQQLGIVTRTRRSRGALGRTTDLVVLSLHREFEIQRVLIRKVRSVSDRPHLQPDNLSTATGQSVRGIMKGTTYPIQERENPSYQGMALGPSRPNLVVAGVTSFDGEDAA